MRLHVILACALAVATAGFAAQAASDQQDTSRTSSEQKSAKKDKSLTIVGCVAADDDAPDKLTIEDKDGTTYRLTGTSLKKYVGQRVEIVGTIGGPGGLHVGFGLLPSPNVAAQAGAMDPAQAAVATSRGGTTSATGGEVQLPEFKVTRVRAARGECP